MCTGCGTRKTEWLRDRFAYVGNIEHCPGCDALAQEQENVRQLEERGAKGLKIGLVLRELAEDDASEFGEVRMVGAVGEDGGE